MATSIEATVWCDFCGDWVQASGGVRDVLAAVRTNGWVRSKDGVNRCQECRLKRKVAAEKKIGRLLYLGSGKLTPEHRAKKGGA